MTKGAINALTLSLAKHLASRRITVNTLAPGITDTDQNADWLTAETKQTVAGLTALGRVGAAADIADAVAFLASDDSRWVTNQYIDVSGGLRISQIGLGHRKQLRNPSPMCVICPLPLTSLFRLSSA